MQVTRVSCHIFVNPAHLDLQGDMAQTPYLVLAG